MNELAKMIVDIATGHRSDDVPARGRSGGLSGGKARAEKLTPEERKEIARKAAARRWDSNG